MKVLRKAKSTSDGPSKTVFSLPGLAPGMTKQNPAIKPPATPPGEASAQLQISDLHGNALASAQDVALGDAYGVGDLAGQFSHAASHLNWPSNAHVPVLREA